MSEQALDQEFRGLLKITRHPVQWGIVLFASAHLLAHGYTASIIFFGRFFLRSFFGMLSMDQRRRREIDQKWQVSIDKTSLVPFVALVSGRLRHTLANINRVGLVAGFTLYVAIYWLQVLLSYGFGLLEVS